MLEIKNYVRNPFRVEAVRVTSENMQAVADHCGGTLEDGSTDGLGSYIKVDVVRPVNDRQCRAYVGDWILKAGNGFKVYTNSAFMNTFQPEFKAEEFELKYGKISGPISSETEDETETETETLFDLIRDTIRKAVQFEVTRVIANSSLSSIQDIRKQRTTAPMTPTPNAMAKVNRGMAGLREAIEKVGMASDNLRDSHSQR